MINKKISSLFALTTIFLVSVIVGLFILGKTKEIKTDFAFTEIRKTNFPKKIENNNVTIDVLPCENKIFQGTSKIRVWQSAGNISQKVKIKKEDLEKLPAMNSDEIILVDYENIAKKLNASSQENPVEITITGFAQKCNGTKGVNYASIDYKEGIFDFRTKH